MKFMAWFTLAIELIRILYAITCIFKNENAGIHFTDLCIEAIPTVFCIIYLFC
jgi:hypothetical protein